MEKLSLKSYVWKCVLGAEIVYFLCLVGGLVPWRSAASIALHHSLFETLPGFTWLTGQSIVWGAILMAIFAFVFGSYMVWMHNSSLINK